MRPWSGSCGRKHAPAAPDTHRRSGGRRERARQPAPSGDRGPSQPAITLIKDERQAVPLTLARGAQLLYLSVLDYPSGWRIAAPSRTFIPELRQRWPNVTSIELSDRTTAPEL